MRIRASQAPVGEPPKYWLHESSGVLRPVIEKYLHGDQLTLMEVGIFRIYLRQWIGSPAWEQNPYATSDDTNSLKALRYRVDDLQTRGDISLWLHDAMEIGIDPL